MWSYQRSSDILVFSKTLEEHVEQLQAVFARPCQHNLKLTPSKCELLKTKGHVISEAGISTDPEKTSAIEQWPVLKNILGFCRILLLFYQELRPKLVEPLNGLLQGQGSTAATKSKKRKKPLAEFRWGDKQQKAFDTVKDKLTHPPILAYADYSFPFGVHTDSSSSGLGAVLYQNQQGVERVITYASRGLRLCERNYPGHKLEILSLKWAVTDKFHDYLYGSSYYVITDNNPLTYVLTKAKLDVTSHRWVAAFANYNFTLSLTKTILE